jgi:hypothetical protein
MTHKHAERPNKFGGQSMLGEFGIDRLERLI